MKLLCRLGWHKARTLSIEPYRVAQGCDRCGKRRLTFKNSYGRPIEVTPWT